MPSFASESTFEYPIIKNIERLLSMYRCVFPFKYSNKREGNNVSKKCFKERKFKVFAVYPRRTKPTTAYSNNIEINVHDTVSQEILILKKNGIDSFICTCFSNSFEGIYDEDNLIFFDNLYSSGFDNIIHIYDDKIMDLNENLELLDKKEFVRRVESIESRSWLSIIDCIEKWRVDKNLLSHNRYLFWGSRHKPIFFLVSN